MTLADQQVRRYREEVAGLARTLPDVAEAYHNFTGECFAPGELDERTKHLIALGVALFANNEICTFYHVQEARSKGASDREIMEAIAVATAAASGHALSQGVLRVQETLLADAGRITGYRETGMQDYLQDTEFSTELDSSDMDIPEGVTVSPSF